MNIFFGKISTKFEKKQIDEGYYKAPKASTWFGNDINGKIDVGDYAFIIGGNKIQLWKAREWGKHNEEECLWFDILNSNLGIKTNRFTALKLFKLTTDLIIHTSRSAKNRAFFKLEPLKQINLEEISNSNFYKNEDLYRKTVFNYNIPSDISWSEDLNFYFDNGELKLFRNSFTEESVLNSFRDNLSYSGRGAVLKDKLLKEVLKVRNIKDTLRLKYNQYSLRTVYDTFFCEYQTKEKYYLLGAFWKGIVPEDQMDRFLKNNIWENGPDGSMSNEVSEIPINSNVAIRSLDKKGNKMYIKAIGKVIKNYKNGKRLDVEWKDDFNGFKLNFISNYWSRVNEVKNNDHKNAIWNHIYENNVPQVKMKENNYTPSLNQIFYGPPGTGKTYNTVLEAAKIITGDEFISYDKALDVFNNQLGSQIEFVTFHQNYSYEDFIQGLRPDVKQKELSFNKTDGIFTKLVTNALFEYYKEYQKKHNNDKELTKLKIDLNEAYIDFLSTLIINQEFETKTGAVIKIVNFTDKQNIEFKPVNGVKPYLVSGRRLLKLYKIYSNINEINNVSEDIREAIGGCNATMYYVALREFSNFLKDYESNFTEFSNSYEEEEETLTYERKKELLLNFDISDIRTIQSESVKKYVIIIDEINRANISRVFGELITLIERDKRTHGKIPLSATLPSGEKFIVPSNLYIIGTMNTADKSIALLDIALRRRFEFKPMYPKYQLDNGILINNAELLEKINKEIINRKGHDFTIGHAYFMGEDYSLENTINNKVIPLLLEYFMNDEKEVQSILNSAGVKVEGWPMQFVGND
ncbi:McrB family protein [uncultured Tenacibaculum sp.]|uniref:McrB family protein n=1 Tax=uncultured Tenacibaculum sp. TaxID=174713 RepID=UPI00262B0C64|nr:AAA family ATPase [uncultured Tenacibaculum sp.]